ncbi:unnamed protein product [Amoebophrya sp. A25]|nr:unnamed protein product [Amoebophrya sp. A25]|eukprot:GSA25T00002032001.1
MSGAKLVYDYQKGWPWMVILAVQFAIQPLLTQSFSGDFVLLDPVINPRIMVLITELAKVVISLVSLFLSGTLMHDLRGMSYRTSVVPAFVPSISYSLQNILIYLAYLSLDPLVANLLNPTKVAFTVLFTYLLLGRQTNRTEMGAVGLLFVAVVVLKWESPDQVRAEKTMNGNFAFGFVYALGAAFLSGFGSAMCERSMLILPKATGASSAGSGKGNASDDDGNSVDDSSSRRGITSTTSISSSSSTGSHRSASRVRESSIARPGGDDLALESMSRSSSSSSSSVGRRRSEGSSGSGRRSGLQGSARRRPSGGTSHRNKTPGASSSRQGGNNTSSSRGAAEGLSGGGETDLTTRTTAVARAIAAAASSTSAGSDDGSSSGSSAAGAAVAAKKRAQRSVEDDTHLSSLAGSSEEELMLVDAKSVLPSSPTASAIDTGKKSAYLFSLELSFATFVLTLVQVIGIYVWEYYLSSFPIFRDFQSAVPTAKWPAVAVHTPTLSSCVPLFVQASGGIVVGQVTKYVGGVAKGFTIVCGIVLTAIINAVMQGKIPSLSLYAAVILVMASVFLQARATAAASAAAAAAKKTQ